MKSSDAHCALRLELLFALLCLAWLYIIIVGEHYLFFH